MTNLGIFGAGMIANLHAEAAVRAGSTISSVFDPVRKKAQAFGKQHGCAVANDIDEMLQNNTIDGIVIAVPNDMHAELAIAGLNAKKDVLLEKPMAITTRECDEIIAAANSSGSVLQLGFVCRYAPAAIKAKELISLNNIGKVQNVNATLIRHRGIPGLGGWFTTKARSGGGCLIDIGVHLIDLVMHITDVGIPKTATGICKQTFSIDNYSYDEMWSDPVKDGVFDVEDSVKATVRFEDGASLQLDIAWATELEEGQWKDGLVIEGETGSLAIDLWGDTIALRQTCDGVDSETMVSIDVKDAWEEAFQAEHVAFSSAVETRSLQVNAGSASDGRNVQLIVDAIYNANSSNKEVMIAI